MTATAKRRPGRPPTGRTVSVLVRLEPGDYAEIRAQAERRNLSAAAYLREAGVARARADHQAAGDDLTVREHDRVHQAAQALGEDVSEYVRRAVLARLGG